MNPKVFGVIGCFALLGLANLANADLIWDWALPEDDIALLPTQTLYIGGTLYNYPSSTETLKVDAFSWWISGDLDSADFWGGLYNYNATSNVPGGLFENDQGTNIFPGHSYTFTIANFEPIAPIGVGTHFTWTVQLYNNFDEPSEGSITRSLNVTIAPLPSSLPLVLSGLLLLAMRPRGAGLSGAPQAGDLTRPDSTPRRSGCTEPSSPWGLLFFAVSRALIQRISMRLDGVETPEKRGSPTARRSWSKRPPAGCNVFEHRPRPPQWPCHIQSSKGS